ncbi:MAG TPA: LpqB family beta-propeller domain-containing protein, partial [Gaiellales bacterium]
MPPSPRTLVLAQIALGDPSVAPDGSHAVYTRRAARRDGYRRHVWVVPLDGGRARALTSGDVRDSGPRFDPPGGRVLFLRDDQVWAVPLAGGEPRVLTALAHGVAAFRLSADGTRLALAAAVPETRFAVGVLTGDTPPLARVVTRVDWRLDGSGV